MAKRYGLDERAMIAARALLEQQQAAEHAAINDEIRRRAGFGPSATEAQPEADLAPKRADANAGAGAAGPPPDVETTADKMNRWLRARGRGFA